ncbi:hypothetical protein QUB37_03760 [Microcoleus sp. AT3-A2]|uniref:hypothetical protein n=1 Tax=Microcoleus sp. AT3-A2 TaxID=2818610 RepID=UPI002FD53E0F
MQITLVSSGDTVSDVLSRFETNFSFDWDAMEKKFNHWKTSVFEFLAKAYSIRELKAMTDFLATAFNIEDLAAPKRNSKVSLAGWIAQVLLSAREVIEISEEELDRLQEWREYYRDNDDLEPPEGLFLTADEVARELLIAFPPSSPEVEVLEPEEKPIYTISMCTYRGPKPETDSTSGLIISFGKILEYLPEKSVTRRTWKDAHAQKFINAFNQNKLVKAFDKDIRYGGKQIGWCRLSCAPYKEQLSDMPEKDLLAEGGMCSTIGEFVQQYFDGNPRLEVWVIRFEFIADSVVASEINPVAATDQATDSPPPEIEVLEPEEKPVYTISIVADGGFSEERVNRLPPFLIDRKGNLLKKFWHCSCDAGYSEITSKHLSDIAINSGLVVKLMAESLEVSQACIVGDPPPFVVDKGGVYRRDQVRRGLAVNYSQVISEYLSNIAVA